MTEEQLWSSAEQIAVVFGLLSVWFERNKNILLYPIGLVSVSIYILICYRGGIYADMLINCIYFVMSIYGWWQWSLRTDKKYHVPVSKNTKEQNTFWIGVTLLLWGILYTWLKSFTDSSIPIIDSFTTALSITGMFLLAGRKIENWIYWIIADVICIPMFYYKGLALTAFQFFIFTLVAISGYVFWKREITDESLH